MPGKSTIKHKVCRALGINVIGSPSAALTLSRRPNRPGQHGASRQAKISPFGQQLRETQNVVITTKRQGAVSKPTLHSFKLSKRG